MLDRSQSGRTDDGHGLSVAKTRSVLKSLTVLPEPAASFAMVRVVAVAIQSLVSLVRSRRELLLENLALRQQLATIVQKAHPRIRVADRVFWVALRRVWSRWAEALVVVKPETVVRWHRAGYRVSGGDAPVAGGAAADPRWRARYAILIRRMASENHWRAPRIHGELLRLGVDVSERTVSRYLRAVPS